MTSSGHALRTEAICPRSWILIKRPLTEKKNSSFNLLQTYQTIMNIKNFFQISLMYLHFYQNGENYFLKRIRHINLIRKEQSI